MGSGALGFSPRPCRRAHWTRHPPGLTAFPRQRGQPARRPRPGLSDRGRLVSFGRSGHQVEGRLCFLRVSRAVRSDLIWGGWGADSPRVFPPPGGCFRVSRLVTERVHAPGLQGVPVRRVPPCATYGLGGAPCLPLVWDGMVSSVASHSTRCEQRPQPLARLVLCREDGFVVSLPTLRVIHPPQVRTHSLDAEPVAPKCSIKGVQITWNPGAIESLLKVGNVHVLPSPDGTWADS